MINTVYLRPLRLEDAKTSYNWRNNPRIWKHTGSQPDRLITEEMETEWLASKLTCENEKRFAICLIEDDKYIGNVFITGIENNSCEIHIFIGDNQFWGKGRAYEAACLLLKFVFEETTIENVYAKIKTSNAASIALTKLTGFVQVASDSPDIYNFIFTRHMFEQKVHVKANSGTNLSSR